MKEAVSAADEARAAIADKKAALEAATKERTEALLQVRNFFASIQCILAGEV